MLPILLDTARNAGNAIMRIYEQPFEVAQKTDNSPLTAADLASNQVIIEALTQHFPHIPYISEESKLTDYAIRKTWDSCWLIDPLDGTKEFVKRNGEFTVNIALIKNGLPIIGVIYVPVQQTMYYAQYGQGSYKLQNGLVEKLSMQSIAAATTVRIVASRSHLNAETADYIAQQQQQYGAVELVSAGSSLKFCLIAEGKAHLYPRFAPTMEWDTAAGHLIATEAGAKIVQYPNINEALHYNKADLLNPYFLVSKA